jgi:hypothetical protein
MNADRHGFAGAGPDRDAGRPGGALDTRTALMPWRLLRWSRLRLQVIIFHNVERVCIGCGAEAVPSPAGEQHRYVHRDSGAPVRDIVPPGFLYAPDHPMVRVFETRTSAVRAPEAAARRIFAVLGGAPGRSSRARTARIARAYLGRGLRPLDDGDVVVIGGSAFTPDPGYGIIQVAVRIREIFTGDYGSMPWPPGRHGGSAGTS